MNISVDVKVAANGRLVLPRAVRDALGISGEGKVVLTVEGDGVRLVPVQHEALLVQDMYRRMVTDPSTVDDFLRERKAEARRDDS